MWESSKGVSAGVILIVSRVQRFAAAAAKTIYDMCYIWWFIWSCFNASCLFLGNTHIKTKGKVVSQERNNWQISVREKPHAYLFHKDNKPNISFCQKSNILPFEITHQVSDKCPLHSALWRIMWLTSAYLHVLYTTRQITEKHLEMVIMLPQMTLFFQLSKIAK